MFVTKLKIVTAVALALGLLGVGCGLYLTSAAAQTPPATVQPPPVARAPVKEEDKKADAKEEKINLPTGPAPVQVLASLNKDGKLVVKSAVMGVRAFGGGGPARVGGGGVGPVPVPGPGGPGPGGQALVVQAAAVRAHGGGIAMVPAVL